MKEEDITKNLNNNFNITNNFFFNIKFFNKIYIIKQF